MKPFNFIPAHRVEAKRRHRRIRRWTAVSAAYLAVLLAAYAGLYALCGGGRTALADEQAKTDSRIKLCKQTIQSVQQELAAKEQRLKANQTVEKQPAWSLLLALLPASLGSEVFLTRCELRPDLPAPAAAATATTPGTGLFVLKMSGYGRSMQPVLQLARELERMELFDHVKLVKTTTEPLGTGTATAFQFECSLGGKGGRTK